MDDWKERFFAVIEERIEAYRTKGRPFNGSEVILEYLERNRNLLQGRPQCFIHGDLHEGNLMVGDGGELYVIDMLDEGFGNHGDPWYDFKTFGENDNAYFSTGFVRGYFNGEPPQEFWDVLTYYYVNAALTGIIWTMHNKPEELEQIIQWNERNAACISKEESPLMKWYRGDFFIQWIDGVPCRMKERFNFSFLNKYGKVFKVYDAQDSGNICFGMTDGDNKYFVKFAGAPTERSNVTADEAVDRMKNTVPIYRDLAHPILTRLIDAEEIGGGFAMVFEWADAECMGRQYPQSRERFMQMPHDIRLRVFDEILAFHAHVAKQGYVAIDFYDGCIMYDFNTDKSVICDIEFYAKLPYTNNMGRMWGSSRFMSPEEFELGAAIDEITNVYTMGATAFAFFGNERDRCLEQWILNKELCDVAKKAVSDDRSQRQQSIEHFIMEWRAVKGCAGLSTIQYRN
jgi:serine/threonine-protein kinase